MFRDQTSTAERNVRTRPVRRKDAAIPALKKAGAVTTKREQVDIGPSLQPSITISIEQRAHWHFGVHWTTIHGPSFGFNDRLLAIYRSYEAESVLTSSVLAVALASYAHHVRSTDLVRLARCQYVAATSRLNAALASPGTAVKDSTLIAVLLLGLYEMITGRDEQGRMAWRQHINGAAALLELRGSAQLKSPMGRGLFLQATVALMTSCMEHQCALPPAVLALTAQVLDALSGSQDSWTVALRLNRASVAYTNYRAALEGGALTQQDEILEGARAIEDDLAWFWEHTPVGWAFESIEDVRGDDKTVFKGRWDAYESADAASVWNQARNIRMLLHWELRGALSRMLEIGESEVASQFEESGRILKQMQREVFACTPQHLGYVLDTVERSEEGQIREARRSEKMVSSAGYYLMWPLWIAGAVDVSDRDEQQYAAKQLRFIGDEMGIRQALAMANTLST